MRINEEDYFRKEKYELFALTEKEEVKRCLCQKKQVNEEFGRKMIQAVRDIGSCLGIR